MPARLRFWGVGGSAGDGNLKCMQSVILLGEILLYFIAAVINALTASLEQFRIR